ncbi:DNA-binding MarR family transcriptional regulator [Mumia flava]|uniref:DNA-binding MarR family transcriptional regulator n=1 Tax=Mumia flava TaxID=1348852 RepID=A0A2M9B8M3_9ACTN|nr:MarR family winged helix-turn-helix transcriptional regulator [Mumia flava]PJJ54295.1 DNA-binding MarR family transcriptional regulator [Mumia flava]
MESSPAHPRDRTSENPAGRAPGGVALTALCGHLLRRSYQVHQALWAEEVGDTVTSRQYAVLGAVRAYPGTDQRGIGALAFLDRTSTMEVLRRLERRGWLERQRDVTDGRRHVLTVTPDGLRTLGAVAPAVGRVQDRLLEPVAAGEREAFLDALRSVGRVGDRDSVDDRTASPLVLPGHLVRRSQQVHTELFAAELGGRITGPQYAALHVVVASPGVSQSGVADRAAFDRTTVGEVVARLRERGWVAQERDPADGRRRVLTPTPEGERAAYESAPAVAAVQEQLMHDLDPPTRARLLDDLRALARLP